MVEFLWFLMCISGWVGVILVSYLHTKDMQLWEATHKRMKQDYLDEHAKATRLAWDLNKVYHTIQNPGKN